MACLSILPIIIIIVLLINIFNNNDENLNIFLIILICFFIIFQFIKKNNKKENVDNIESLENIPRKKSFLDKLKLLTKKRKIKKTEEEKQESNSSETDKTEEEKQDSEKKNEIKYLSVDKDFINNLVNKDRMFIDNLKVKTIDSDFVNNLLYPIGVIVFSWLPLEKLHLPGTWKALPGSRLITTTGNLKYSITKGQTEKDIKFNDKYSNTYTEYNCDFENINEDIIKHEYLSTLDKTQDKVKLCANNVMNHKHIVYVNYGRVSRAKGGSQHAFALYGNGKDNQKDRCNDNSVKRIQSSYEVFPSRRTVYYDGDVEKTITLDSVKAHTNIPRYVLLYTYERIK